MVSLGTGKAPARTFEEQNEEAKMRPEVIEEVIKRTFGNSKAKTNGTGIWLRPVSKSSFSYFLTVHFHTNSCPFRSMAVTVKPKRPSITVHFDSRSSMFAGRPL